MRTGFIVRSLSIEGFKGFTTQSRIDVDGRHVFLLGENGNGKSSIIEAVRWGLFGSTNRPNEIVANRDYQVRCRVEINLTREAQRFRLQRTLLRGVSGGSDAELYDDNGSEVPIRDVMPQLDSVDAGEGMHIIFASQSTPLRRQATDLSSFERTVFNHLGLSHPKALLDRVNTVLIDQEILEDNLGQRIDDVRDEITAHFDRLQRQRVQFIESPPWKEDRTPTRSSTEEKTKRFIVERLGDTMGGVMDGISLEALLERASDALQDRASKTHDQLDLELQPIENHIEALMQLQLAMSRRDEITAEIQNCVKSINGLLDGTTLEELRRRSIEIRQKMDIATRQRQIDMIALTLCDDGESREMSCPLCEKDNHSDALAKSIRQRLDETKAIEGDDVVDKNDQRIASIGELYQRKRRSTDLMKSNLDEAQGYADTLENGKQYMADPTLIEPALDELHASRDDLKAQITDVDQWMNESRAQLSALEDEARFLELQREITRIDGLRLQLESVQRRLKEFSEFGEATRAVHTEIEDGLNDVLRRDIPKVSDAFTKVFNALTQHPRYDLLRFDDGKLPSLELMIGSSQDPTDTGHSTDVLNGQAESALLLVPYFAFSQDDDAPTEAYLVLLDDPTRAFDERHIEVLVEQLAELGRHVQLFVASQETKQFRDLVPKYFAASDYVIVEPKAWAYRSGPDISIEFPDS